MPDNETHTTARNFLKIRTDSLLKDVRYCVMRNEGTLDWPAPFPAILYCFSMIDLLGALYAGDAGRGSKTTKMAKKYMAKIMQYPCDAVNLLQKIFRHKLVHLAQPQPCARLGDKIFLWSYDHNDRNVHLKQSPTGNADEFIFSLSIYSFAEDIADSVYRPNGYLHQLELNQKLQDNFIKAHQEIFG